MDRISFRQATISDVGAIRSLWRAFWPEMPYEKNLEFKIQKDPELVLVAEAGNAIIGTVIGGFDGWWAWIYRLAVDKAYQRQGIGTRLLKDIEEQIKKRGSTNICAIVSGEDEAVNRVMGKFGMFPVEQAFVGKRLQTSQQNPNHGDSVDSQGRVALADSGREDGLHAQVESGGIPACH